MAQASAQTPKSPKPDKKPAALSKTGAAKKILRTRLADEPSLIPEAYQDAIALGALAFLFLVFFWQALFGGKVFYVPDNIASLSTTTYLNDAKADGIFPLWFPYIFGGMPSYGSLFTTGDRSFDFLHQLWGTLMKVIVFPSSGKEVDWLILYYFFFGAGIYALLRLRGLTAVQSLVAAIGGSFATLSLVWIAVGHNTKMWAIAPIPYLLIFIEQLRTQSGWRSTLFNVAVLAFAIHTQDRSTHVQMMFYSFLAIGIYFLFELIRTLVSKDLFSNWFRSAAGFAVAALLGLSMSADTYLSVYEYNPYSIRGAKSVTERLPELSQTPDSPAKQSGEGLDYDYATNWSFGPSEVLTFFFPYYYGFGDNSYWGPELFTHSPQYFGVTVLILAVIGLFYYRREAFVQALIAIGVLSLFISFGKYFPVIFDPMFYYFPVFNKFRAPMTILVLLQLAACLLAGYGVRAAFEMREADEKEKSVEATKQTLSYAAIGFTALFLFSLVGISGCKEGYTQSVAQSDFGRRLTAEYGQKVPNVVQRVVDDYKIFDNFRTDVLVSMLLAAALVVMLYLFASRRMPRFAFELALVLLVAGDLWRINTKTINSLTDRKAQSDAFSPTDFSLFLTADASRFRVLPLLREGAPAANWYAYFRIESVGGYQGAKMRVFQDLVDVVGNGSPEGFFQNQTALDLFNVKYVLLDKPYSLPNYKLAFSGTKTVLEREGGAARAWLVGDVQQKTDIDIIRAIKDQSFNPKQTAFVEVPPPAVEMPDSAAGVEVTGSGIHHLDLKVNASGNHFLVVSEMHYPKGWRCTIDGLPAEILKTDYAFRGVAVPKGQHTVVFQYESAAFAIGKTLSIVANALVALTLVGLGADALRRSRAASGTDKKTGEPTGETRPV